MKQEKIDHSKAIPLLSLESQLKRELRKHLHDLGFTRNQRGNLVPPSLTKAAIRHMHLAQRDERLKTERKFILRNWPKLQRYFAEGSDVSADQLSPALELIHGDTWQSDLFRLASLIWSVPVSRGYGRRMRFLVWDTFNGKLMGLIALGDPVFNLRVRDDWIGWNLEERTNRLVSVMDAYVLGGLPPYNILLGGKLIACLVRSKEIALTFVARYSKTAGIISNEKKDAKLCLVTTTSALGKSSIYNRLRLHCHQYFLPIGYTSGWGHFHIPDSLFQKMRRYLAQCEDRYAINHQFGDGPNWKLRAIRKVLARLGINPSLLRHGIPRQVFVSQLADNAREALCGDSQPSFASLRSVDEVAAEARHRWIIPRAERKREYRSWKKDQLLTLLGLSPGSTLPYQQLLSERGDSDHGACIFRP